MKIKMNLSICVLIISGLLIPSFLPGQIQQTQVFVKKKLPKVVYIGPIIKSFTASTSDCKIVRGGFLSYRIINQIREIKIYALYKDGHRLMIYQKPFFNPPYGRNESNIAHPSMDGGIVSYLLEVIGPTGLMARKSLRFRTPITTFFALRSNRVIKTYGHRGRRDSTVHYQVRVRYKNIKRVACLVKLLPSGKKFVVLPGKLGANRVSFGLIAPNNILKMAARFEIHAYGNNGCREKDFDFKWIAYLPADR